MTNYAKQAGTFQALAQMMRDDIRALERAEAEDNAWQRDWYMKSLLMLARHTDAALAEYGIEQSTLTEKV